MYRPKHNDWIDKNNCTSPFNCLYNDEIKSIFIYAQKDILHIT